MKKDKTMLESLQEVGVKKILGYLDKDPDTNIPKILRTIKRLDFTGAFGGRIDKVEAMLTDTNSNWYKLVRSLWTDIDDEVRKTMFINFLLYATIMGDKRQEETKKKYDINVPWAILLDPTSACNLHCTGCWAAEYGNKLNMSFETLDSIVTQGKEMGTMMYIFTGGEPLVRKADVLRLCEKHSDCMFLAFTNATLIDEQFAEDMLRVKNFIPAMSIEGFEEATDSRRGNGTYQKVIRAMEILREHKLPFGISCCYTSQNAEVIGSEAYIDDMIAKGVKFAWFFTYMPVGKDAVPELMATAEQREYMYHQIREFRSTKPLFTMDFWNDGEYVNGCIAGGRCYLHINANGDIEPCAFIHYADSNIYKNTLLEAYQNPMFQQYKQGQPFNGNMLRPCPLLDNPGALAGMVERSGATSTDLQCPEDVHDLSAKCKDVAERWAPVADKLWSDSPRCKNNCAACHQEAE